MQILGLILLSIVINQAVIAADLMPPGACKLNDNFFSTDKGGCLEKRSGLVWSAPAATELRIKPDALDYCNRIEGGYEDWRLPTMDELLAVAGETRAGAHFNFQTDRYFLASNIGGEDGSQLIYYMVNLFYHYRDYVRHIYIARLLRWEWSGPNGNEGIYAPLRPVLCVRKAE